MITPRVPFHQDVAGSDNQLVYDSILEPEVHSNAILGFGEFPFNDRSRHWEWHMTQLNKSLLVDKEQWYARRLWRVSLALWLILWCTARDPQGTQWCWWLILILCAFLLSTGLHMTRTGLHICSPSDSRLYNKCHTCMTAWRCQKCLPRFSSAMMKSMLASRAVQD